MREKFHFRPKIVIFRRIRLLGLSLKKAIFTVKLIDLNYRAGKNTKVGTPTLPEAMERAVGLMAPDRHVANRVIILVSAVYRSTDIQSVKGTI